MFLERLNLLIKQRGITKKQFLEDCGLGKNSFSHWETRGNIPTTPILTVISQYFNVSIDYLLGNTEQKEKPVKENDELLESALQLMRSLDPDTQKQAIKYLEFLNQKDS